MKKVAVYALTPQGASIGRVLADRMEGDLYLPSPLARNYGAVPFEGIRELVAESFYSYPQHVFVAAAGIVVRVVASHLRSKAEDPAVVVTDQEGKYVVSLLSGHLGGANILAREVAAITKGVPVITTATDTEGLPSFDLLAEEGGLVIENLGAVKAVNMAMLKGAAVQVYDPENRLGLARRELSRVRMVSVVEEENWDRRIPGVWVSWREEEAAGNRLVLHPRCLVGGVGCNRGTRASEILGLIRRTFRGHHLSLKSLRCLVTIEEKRDERGLLVAARELGLPVFFFSASEIGAVEVPNPSGVVKRHMGVSSVCEAAALLETGGKRLVVSKTKSRNATLAVALEG